MKGQKMQKNKRKQENNSKGTLIRYALIASAIMLTPLEVCVVIPGVLLLTGLTGCARQQQFKAVEQICVSDTGKAEAMRIGEDVLGRMHFTIAKADAEQGLIRTKPLPAAQSFEFWRSDNVGSFNSTEANLHSIRRIVELDISQQGGRLCIICNVKVQRLSLPEREVTSTARAYEMFSPSHPSIQRLRLHPEQKEKMAWSELGSDRQLATDILKRISSMLDTSGKDVAAGLDIENRESSIE